MKTTLGILLWIFVICGARADDQHHPASDMAIHEQFYSGWYQPDNPAASCCSNRDCAPVRHVRRVGNRWEAQRESDGEWFVIPQHKIEQRRDSPDGRSHMCSLRYSVLCFVLGSGI